MVKGRMAVQLGVHEIGKYSQRSVAIPLDFGRAEELTANDKSRNAQGYVLDTCGNSNS